MDLKPISDSIMPGMKRSSGSLKRTYHVKKSKTYLSRKKFGIDGDVPRLSKVDVWTQSTKLYRAPRNYFFVQKDSTADVSSVISGSSAAATAGSYYFIASNL